MTPLTVVVLVVTPLTLVVLCVTALPIVVVWVITPVAPLMLVADALASEPAPLSAGAVAQGAAAQRRVPARTGP
ncbi:MAG TPA: hypothetical protein VG848_06885 [Acetobacteraceae bacterium]|nr:hypothetical protein [Acetobacteraceae bacterium]